MSRLGAPTAQRPYGHLPDAEAVGCGCPCHETEGPVYEDIGDACGYCLVTHMPCEHKLTRRLYEQRPPSEGRKLVAVRRLCASCGAVLPLSDTSTGARAP